MAKKWITNNHTANLDFPLESGGFEVIEPGKSANIAIKDFDSAHNQGMRHAGLYLVSDSRPDKNEAAPPAPTVTRPSTTE